MIEERILQIFDLDDEEARKLGLSKMIEVKWWGPDLIEIYGRKSFYYSDSEGINKPIKLAPAYPACLIIREEEEINEKTKSLVKIKGLPNNSLSVLRASHYNIGPSYGQKFNWETSVGNSFYIRRKLTQIAPITFFRIK